MHKVSAKRIGYEKGYFDFYSKQIIAIMKKILTCFLVSTSVVCLTGCATVFHGTQQTVHVTSNPPGATVEVDGLEKGVTPVDVSVKKGFTGQTIVLKKTGYETKSFQPAVKFDPISLINVFAIIGFGVDAITGAMMQYAPTLYDVPLTKKP